MSNSLIKQNQLTEEFFSIVTDKSITSTFETLSKYLSSIKTPLSKTNKQKIQSIINNTISEQLRKLAFIQYFLMEKTNSWGNGGEQQSKIGFCRNLLKIPFEKTLSNDDASAFMTLVREAGEEYDILDASQSSLQQQYNNFTIKIGPLLFKVPDSIGLNNLLTFIESDTHYYAARVGSDHMFIFGNYTKEDLDRYEIIHLNDEIIRSPKTIMAMAASNNSNIIHIRKESLETIFHQKWIQCFQYGELDILDIGEKDERNISEGIKQKALSLYGINEEKDLHTRKEQFLDDMKNTILFHEVGHGVSLREIMSFEVGSVSEASKLFGENILSSLLEFLADFCPQFGGLKGAIQNMIDISKTDPKRAEGMFYMYFSDTWFFDTEDEYMYSYSEMMALLMLKYINKDKSINWNKVQKDVSYDPVKPDDEEPSMVERVMNLLTLQSGELKKMIGSSKFKLSGPELKSFDYVKNLTLDSLKKNGVVDENDYGFMCKFWSYLIEYCKKLTPEKGENLVSFLKQEERKTLQRMFILSAGRKKAEAYDFNHRKYIMEQCKELGITLTKE
ncbi:hypothetical protein HOG98_03170 [bacterium]|jgi:hypothetical protein|nr:hypothetical protein [bacterium]